MQTSFDYFKQRVSSQIKSYMTVPLYRNAHALMLNTVATSGLGVVYWVLAARYYDKQEIGLGSAAISTMMFLSGLAQLNMGSTLNRFIPRAGDTTRRLVAYVYLVSSVLAVLIAAGFTVAGNLWLGEGNFIRHSLPFAIWYVISVVTWGIFTLQDSAITGLRQAFWLPLENASFGFVKIVLLIAFAPLMPVYGIFASWTIPMVLSLVPINILIFSHLIPRQTRASQGGERSEMILARVGPFVTGDYVGSLFYLSSTMLLPILVINVLGSRQNAYFYIAWVIGSSLDLFSTNMAASLTAEAAADQTKLLDYSKKSLIHMARIMLPAAIALFVTAPLLLSIFGADYANNATPLLRLLSVALVPKAINTLFLGIARVHRHVGHIVLVQAVLCVLVLGLSIVFTRDYGITGIGIAWLTAQTVVAVALATTQFGSTLFRKPGKKMASQVSD
jgi:O-antigen/teichoic acid export membrane protein